MNIILQVTDKIQKLVEIKVMKLCSCKFQYNQINQMCNYNQNNIEICSTQQVKADEELLYTETDFLRHMHWRAFTGFHSHASPHVDNITL